jgi:L-iditol 2-dehydrogenase
MEQLMKTLVVGNDGIPKVAECPIPDYGDCEALVKTVSCGICNGTDMKLIHGNFKGFSEDMYPVMLGHEAVGRVIETGKNVTSYQKGNIVLLPFAGPLGGFASAWGGFSEYGIVIDAAALKKKGIMPRAPEFPECACAQTVVPGWIDPVQAAMIVTLREVLSAIKRFGMKQGKSVAVYGCGPVGLTYIKFMHLLGIGPVFALDVVNEKLKAAKEEGADYIFYSNESAIEKIREICPEGVDFVLDAVGVSAIINQGMHLIKDQGKICCYGISANTVAEIDWTSAPYNWQLVFQQFPSKYEEGEADTQVLTWLNEGKISLEDFISDIITFDNILEAFHKVEKKQISKKCIIKYE